MPKFRFPLAKNTPTDSEYKEICPDGGSRPPCQIRVTAQGGAYPPSDSHGNLTVVNLPLEPAGNGCETLVEVFMQTGCPPDTPDLICDDDKNPTNIAQNSSETIWILDGKEPYEWEIVAGYGFSLATETTNDLGGRPDERANSSNTLYSSADSCGTAQVKVTDNCQTEIVCEFSCEQYPVLEYDDVNSGHTVAQNNSVSIQVVGGSPPYMWSVSGAGFTVHSTETYGINNTIYADGSACGFATITVIDICGTTVTGGIRCTDAGQWVEVDLPPQDLAGYVSGAGGCAGVDTIELIQGKYKMWEHIPTICQAIAGMPCPADSCMESWQLSSSLFGGTPIDCYDWRINGCGSTVAAGLKDGLCCWATSSNVRDRVGVQDRRVWEWTC